MAKMKIVKLQRDLQGCSFDCGNPSINALVKESFYPTLLQHLYAFEVLVDDVTVGYYMIGFRRLSLAHCPDEVSDYTSNMSDLCYSLHLKYIAVDKNFQHCGIGRRTLQLLLRKVVIMCNDWPIRLITLHALKEKIQWYQSIGFSVFCEEDLNNEQPDVEMYMDLLLNKEAVMEYCS
ncbi:MAG: GNAT family N-acetyltransferase [Clostridiales bacterium]|nr:GNAT family N-acetyltransferase [Clostridiales bacterium]